MNKKIERILILSADLITINLAWVLFFYFKVETGFFKLLSMPDFWQPMIAIYFYWTLIFLIVGMYRTWFASSRFDELTRLFKATAVGIFVLFFLIMLDDYVNNVSSSTRFIMFFYWFLLLILVATGRLFIRAFQRRLLLKGIGRNNALIVGYNKKAENLYDSIEKHKVLGIDVKAFLSVKEENVGKTYKSVKVVDTIDKIKNYVKLFNIKQIIIALENKNNDTFFKIVDLCDGVDVSIKIVPDLYEIISGQARTMQIYGFPLIDIMPQLMPVWEKQLKRVMDISVSILFLLFTLPITLITAIAIKIESKGPVFYIQERLGMKGKKINIIKFRSMVVDAEKKSGPVWASKNDSRITRVGAFIRKTRIDEIPQMINVLKGDMSLVGPRPEREHFVEKLSTEIPLYKRRLSVRPGITGWAQVKHKYDESIDDVRTKLKYDLFYIENMSLRMDINILFRTIFVVLFGKGQ